MMIIIFCNEPIRPRHVDSMFESEAGAVNGQSGAYYLISYETLVNSGDAARAVAQVPAQDAMTTAIYRGWMLKPEQYAALHEALLAKNIHLINDPAAYKHCHYLPESYAVIEGHTPKSVWLEYHLHLGLDQIMQALSVFGDSPIVVKDYVKSQKHYWHEAFFIPSASDGAAVERVVTRFIELQGDDLNVGLVFREFIEFEPIGEHSKSGMPFTREYRLFFLNGELLTSAEYWADTDYGAENPPIEQFVEIARQVKSNFFTMDIAKLKDNNWLVVELGDGQVAGLPEIVDVDEFYVTLSLVV